jgi:outer membrane protein TolC
LVSSPVAPGALTIYSLPADVSWEPDIWGKVRRSVEASRASAQASAADLGVGRVEVRAPNWRRTIFSSLPPTLRSNCWMRLCSPTTSPCNSPKNRYAAGVASKADVVLAEAQLKTTQAQAIDVGVQRAQLEHAIALLIGKPASDFSLPLIALAAAAPPVTNGFAIAIARTPARYRRCRATRRSGERADRVTIAAFYPTVTLGLSGGFETATCPNG